MKTIVRAMLGAALLLPGAVQAFETDEFSTTFDAHACVAGARFTFDLAVPTAIVGDATLELTMDGDFNWRGEYADVSIDGTSLGRIMDSNTSNDQFNFANGDNPDHSSYGGSPDTGTAYISSAVMAPLIADGILQIVIQASSFVDWSPTEVVGVLTYLVPRTTSNNVPVGGTLALSIGGLAGLVVMRRRRARRAEAN